MPANRIAPRVACSACLLAIGLGGWGLLAGVSGSGAAPHDSIQASWLWCAFFAHLERLADNPAAQPRLTLRASAYRSPQPLQTVPALACAPQHLAQAWLAALCEYPQPRAAAPHAPDEWGPLALAFADTACTRLTGQPLLRGLWPSLGPASAPDSPTQQEVNHTLSLNASGLAALFDAVYVPPDGFVMGVPGKKIYRAAFRDYVRAFADIVACALDHPNPFRVLAQDYARKAYTDTTYAFHGPQFLRRRAPAHFGPEYARFSDAAANPLGTPGLQLYAHSHTVLGIVVRRHLDGSLPKCLELLKHVLRDYDPEAFAQYGPRLVAP